MFTCEHFHVLHKVIYYPSLWFELNFNSVHIVTSNTSHAGAYQYSKL